MAVSTFKTNIGRARDNFHIGTGRLTQLLVYSTYAHYEFKDRIDDPDFAGAITRQDVTKWAEAFPDLEDFVRKYGHKKGYYRWWKSLPRKLDRILYQQMLVYLVTIFEAFMCEALLLSFQQQPKCLSTKNRSIFWEEVVKTENLDSLINKLAIQKVDSISSGDWYKIGSEFRKLFKIDLSSKANNKQISEVFEIRHAIVHNAGLVDEKLIDKVGSSQWGMQFQLGKYIVLNKKTLNKMINVLDELVWYVYDTLTDKFRK